MRLAAFLGLCLCWNIGQVLADQRDPAYGSGHHGTWITDEFGQPAYRYTGCTSEQTPCLTDDAAIHQLGNDGVNALAHGEGYVELYSARSYHRFANAYHEKDRAYAGGFGWVRDGKETWSTLWQDRPQGSRYERIFGMGYVKRTIEHHDLRLEHYIYLSEGEDAVLRERLIFTNLSSSNKSLTYFNYWDVAWWHPRRIVGIPEASAYDPAKVRTSYDSRRGLLQVISEAEPGDTERPNLWRDPVPQVSFVKYRDAKPDAFETVQQNFWGQGGREHPDAIARGSLQNGIEASGTLANQEAVLVTEKRFMLPPGGRHILDVAFGLAARNDLNEVLMRLEMEPAFTLPEIVAKWAKLVPRVNFGYAWLGRELSWSYYYLRSSVLREDYFNARVLNQGSIYLYQWGTNAGPRSTFRHLLPLIYTEPELARESLLYFLRAMKPNGEMPYATGGYGAWNTQGFIPSDHTFWLLLAAMEYVHATRDYAFLDERITYWCVEGRGRCGSASVYEALVASYLHAKNSVSTGSHGLIRLLNADWDDFIVLFSPDIITSIFHGESTMNTALALAAYPAFAELAAGRGDTATARSIQHDRDELHRAMKTQWRGDHFNRAYVYKAPNVPVELGADSVWIAANGVALGVPDLLSENESQALAVRIARDNFDPSPVGLAAIGSTQFEGGLPGTWYSLAGPTIDGLLQHGHRTLAWRIFLRQTLANHAATHPAYGYGIWTGPDMYFTPLDAAAGLGEAGATWCLPEMCMTDLPATNLFAHSEPLLSSLRIAGVRADARGLRLDPGVPGSFSWTSPGFGMIYENSTVIGWIRAIATDQVVYRVRLPQEFQTEPRVWVNGRPVVATLEEATTVSAAERHLIFTVPYQRGEYAHWIIH
jgi:hypothetical protein